MKLKIDCCWGMYNWAITPIITVWRIKPRGGGIAIHFMRGRLNIFAA